MSSTQKNSPKAQTPSMRQYLTAKESYPDALLFFRMGDFYELFFEDAVTTAKALDLRLTSRDRNDPDPIPMCGVPHHAGTLYIGRLLEQGYNVAICEQLEDPAKAKGVVKRGVVRVLTPATVLDGESLEPRTNQFLAAVVPPEGSAPGRWGYAAFDLSTGEMFTGDAPELTSVAGELARLDVRELIFPRAHAGELKALGSLLPRAFQRLIDPVGPKQASELLAASMGEEALRDAAEGVALAARNAAGLALAYAKSTQPGHGVSVRRLVQLDPRDHLVLDETAQLHLELFATTRGERKGSLLHRLDATVTPMGARRLRTWIAFPLTDVRRIKKRHDAVEALRAQSETRAALREVLENTPDLERIAVRSTLGATTPRDLAHLRDGLAKLPPVTQHIAALGAALKGVRFADDLGPLHALLAKAVVDNPPTALGEGPLLRAGFDARADELAKLAHGGREAVAGFEARERERTKIASLKVSYNRVFGYFIEVTKANLKNVPADYKRKQTVATGERYVTEELYELERKITAAEDELRALEQQRFDELVAEVAQRAGAISRAASVLADLDALGSFAEVAHRYDYARPEIDDGSVIELRDARHPVVEAMLEPGAFVPNDVALDLKAARLLLVTGPNMAGKSTLMRQVALAVLMAQAGSFVPASAARVGVCDRVFTRVGASDDLSRGQSTFMVEMKETAAILRGATTRSLVVFDEIGRGTSTYDGLAIAWAVAEYLHDVVRCRALFATHYHELCTLADARDHAANVNVSARETGDDIVFLHRLAQGGASRSYGIAVAKLAGLPEPVVARAKGLLKDLERGEGPGAKPRQMGLFEPKPEAPEHPALAALKNADIERMTPLDAMNFVFQLRALQSAAEKK